MGMIPFPRVVIVAAFAFALAPALAGCVSDDPSPGSVGTQPTAPTGGSPRPVESSPANGATVAFSEIPPATGEPFATIEVRWTLSGSTGTTAHTAVHADTASHPDPSTLAPTAYPQSYYPGAGPYAVPGEYAAKITLPATGTLYLRPHAIIGGKQVWGEETAVRVEGIATTGVSLVKYPPVAKAGVPLEIQWRVEAPAGASTPHTAIHYGPSSVAKQNADVKPADYPRATDFKNGPLPETFTGTITPTEPGVLYFRGHAVVSGKHSWTDEVAIAVGAPDTPNVVLSSAPAAVEPGAAFTLKWRVNLPANATEKTTPHTAVHYGPASQAGVAKEQLTPKTYPNATAFLNGTIPAAFESTVIAPADATTLFLRAHVVVDGKHYWSDETHVVVGAP